MSTPRLYDVTQWKLGKKSPFQKNIFLSWASHRRCPLFTHNIDKQGLQWLAIPSGQAFSAYNHLFYFFTSFLFVATNRELQSHYVYQKRNNFSCNENYSTQIKKAIYVKTLTKTVNVIEMSLNTQRWSNEQKYWNNDYEQGYRNNDYER